MKVSSPHTQTVAVQSLIYVADVKFLFLFEHKQGYPSTPLLTEQT